MAFRSRTLRYALGILGFVAIAALAAPPALSQAPPAPELLSLNVVTVKPEMLRTYVDLQRSEIIPALQKGGQSWRGTWRHGACLLLVCLSTSAVMRRMAESSDCRLPSSRTTASGEPRWRPLCSSQSMTGAIDQVSAAPAAWRA